MIWICVFSHGQTALRDTQWKQASHIYMYIIFLGVINTLYMSFTSVGDSVSQLSLQCCGDMEWYVCVMVLSLPWSVHTQTSPRCQNCVHQTDSGASFSHLVGLWYIYTYIYIYMIYCTSSKYSWRCDSFIMVELKPVHSSSSNYFCPVCSSFWDCNGDSVLYLFLLSRDKYIVHCFI